MSNEAERVYLEEINRSFNIFRNDDRFKEFLCKFNVEEGISSSDVTSIYNNMVNIYNRSQEGAIIDGRKLKRIWNTLEYLTLKNIQLEEKLSVLKKDH
ncbi:hypothetical protein [Microbulbifer sp. JMSA003]|uniref:hypothetical protein n=1 Tax=unclassified Microbulbifer TaxID=2619833 RepID=UPI0040396677